MGWERERIDQNVYSQGEVDRWVYSTCNICSIGCGCYIAVKDGEIVRIKGNGAHPVNRGRLGPKGENQWLANRSPDRLLQPLLRDATGRLVPVSWDQAMDTLVARSREVLRRLGPNGIAIYSTGQGFLEDYYTIAKPPVASAPRRLWSRRPCRAPIRARTRRRPASPSTISI
ncbi:molybdopterin-dependent oxidoreductase [Alicyclobacillus sp.]|uniref:molybdopterin-dependent oxidoreductase n=1 Tax=Alicyclobacillus sp. TaxID=61169 RepID=UPI0025C4E597|nr:molybdopterin-dependent oxidoreductase [Alicyclobacillus sp.]